MIGNIQSMLCGRKEAPDLLPAAVYRSAGDETIPAKVASVARSLDHLLSQPVPVAAGQSARASRFKRNGDTVHAAVYLTSPAPCSWVADVNQG